MKIEIHFATGTITADLELATPFQLHAWEVLQGELVEDPSSPITIDGVRVSGSPLGAPREILKELLEFEPMTANEAAFVAAAYPLFEEAFPAEPGAREEMGDEAENDESATERERMIAEANAEDAAWREPEVHRSPAVRRLGERPPEPEPRAPSVRRFAGQALHRSRVRGAMRR